MLQIICLIWFFLCIFTPIGNAEIISDNGDGTYVEATGVTDAAAKQDAMNRAIATQAQNQYLCQQQAIGDQKAIKAIQADMDVMEAAKAGVLVEDAKLAVKDGTIKDVIEQAKNPVQIAPVEIDHKIYN